MKLTEDERAALLIAIDMAEEPITDGRKDCHGIYEQLLALQNKLNGCKEIHYLGEDEELPCKGCDETAAWDNVARELAKNIWK